MSNPQVFQCLTLAAAIELYANTGIKANRSYTPTNMLRTAANLTGKTFKRGQFKAASEALRAHAETLK
jgi:hypothetical protein